MSILVTYATGHGSTEGVAREIADTIREAGVQADLRPIASATCPDRYDAVLIGSPIRYDRWLPEAKSYLLKHEAALSERPVAFFFTCMALSVPGGEKQGRTYAEAIGTLSRNVQPVSVGQFAGALDYGNFQLFLRPPARLLFWLLGAKSGDHRNFGAAREWARRCFDIFQTYQKKGVPSHDAIFPEQSHPHHREPDRAWHRIGHPAGAAGVLCAERGQPAG